MCVRLLHHILKIVLTQDPDQFAVLGSIYGQVASGALGKFKSICSAVGNEGCRLLSYWQECTATCQQWMLPLREGIRRRCWIAVPEQVAKHECWMSGVEDSESYVECCQAWEASNPTAGKSPLLQKLLVASFGISLCL